MALTPKTWLDLPAPQQPTVGETLADWVARVQTYATANPTLVTPLSAAALIDLETRLGAYTDTGLALKAPTASPALTGIPTAPTAATADSTTKIATSALVDAKIAAGPGADASTTVKGLAKLSTAPASPTAPIAVGDNDSRMTNARTPTAHSHPESDVTSLASDLALKAPLASPAFTVIPTAPTAAPGTNTTQIATMAALLAAINAALTITTQTGSWTAALADAQTLVKMNSASGTVFTVPPNSSVAFPIGSSIEVLRYGAGAVTITPGAGVTIPNSIQPAGTSSRTITSQMTSVSLLKTATDEWVLSGSIT